MSNHPFKIKSDESLLPLYWWERYFIRYLRELPRSAQLNMLDLLSRFLLVYRCLGEFKPDTQWLEMQEEKYRLRVSLPQTDKDPSSKNGGEI